MIILNFSSSDVQTFDVKSDFEILKNSINIFLETFTSKSLGSSITLLDQAKIYIKAARPTTKSIIKEASTH